MRFAVAAKTRRFRFEIRRPDQACAPAPVRGQANVERETLVEELRGARAVMDVPRQPPVDARHAAVALVLVRMLRLVPKDHLEQPVGRRATRAASAAFRLGAIALLQVGEVGGHIERQAKPDLALRVIRELDLLAQFLPDETRRPQLEGALGRQVRRCAWVSG